jgi:hypothetical protein
VYNYLLLVGETRDRFIKLQTVTFLRDKIDREENIPLEDHMNSFKPVTADKKCLVFIEEFHADIENKLNLVKPLIAVTEYNKRYNDVCYALASRLDNVSSEDRVYLYVCVALPKKDGTTVTEFMKSRLFYNPCVPVRASVDHLAKFLEISKHEIMKRFEKVGLA